ncbi:uncharacterized protein LY89DRAFT_785476 [Mollisia scopiformis]|uniref:2EXR domain-containing protein n=1 Tax=Mollisia scopiformis TaxID=149040 RepID=A0A194WY68_MOLSC|nr:uncharacterized protein LY89DRAFT_785476 [Mollisia scopiformis]KUJ12923.1 hypothetical protein LY89DRAFT_785476 [Mollisia scopiformis]
MAATKFELFPKLPGELRNEIWVAALPQPRLVRIEEQITEEFEDANYDDVIQVAEKRLAALGKSAFHDPPKSCAIILSEILGCEYEQLHQRFRHIWNNMSPYSWRFMRAQTQLEDHGFRTNRVQPSLPPLFLLEAGVKEAIFLATRSSRLWSQCPIPALLHTCRESRHAMELCGYQLAFAAKNSEPQIWFNFKHDVLYLTSARWENGIDDEYFVNGPWNLHQISSTDLGRVEKAALEEAWEPNIDDFLEAMFLFGNLKELLWVTCHVVVSYELDKDKKRLRLDDWGHQETEADLWGYLECENIDFIEDDVLGDMRGGMWGHYASMLRAWRKQNSGSSEGFLTSKNAELEELLQGGRDSGSKTWKIPTIKHAYIVTKNQARAILGRRYFLEQKLQDAERLEDEEGPRPQDRLPHKTANYWAPFDDENAVLEEWYYQYWY